ncbi:PREDICTED: ankyrin repeat and SOCS box protein 12-like [Priapulus caudatus]|uniref:Ankyrin repeat and SOCS box protein 12-like n=1 Tax=Priapulus caudatus TaxID=37621 RepID=A0ABM1E7I0_PRICU|nr:PREDICTED: ankyrin repeat and SOCS box protein 12-like [Priapulus caudatus]XP_014668149.1 PREDICTED: ankyrin repeat and SOCS box protein 12-like [Priapulus caudatus]XP_014668150.1 PREDICTED: ankyrin repeat and SOCS box protein 12-like [Priapulus caudatus]XP_014668151.1 PREDICTED: ankyrin repeat and SOCS box protein 12-like [Priapulus caudatus]XP_014668152.1 PREDICTED: ankyrin repeat and SOCS box protein 12-like [Priapulus caudatus]XP_014668154.1 PREDICTED: ankyrin repeat and SOCS box protei
MRTIQKPQACSQHHRPTLGDPLHASPRGRASDHSPLVSPPCPASGRAIPASPRHHGPTVEDLHQAVRLHDIARVEKIASALTDVSSSLRATTALSLAVYQGHLDTVELLLRHGADVDKLSRDAMERLETPLFSACRLGHTGIARVLIQRGADLNKTDFYAHTPVWINTRDKRAEIIQMLVERGARLNISPAWNQCPLYLAAKFSGRLAIATLLVYHGVRLDVADRSGHSALYWALHNCDRDLARLLVSAGARLNPSWVLSDELPYELQRDETFSDWLTEEATTAPPLLRQCRAVVRDRFRCLADYSSIVGRIEQLPLPKRLLDYVKLKS